jgi:16S rRNA (adenine1518-N6/adenine1519-N6)-dimethyltransferase
LQRSFHSSNHHLVLNLRLIVEFSINSPEKFLMKRVTAKKRLGQHFLKDKVIAGRIASSLSGDGYNSVLEIGPGMGILSRFLMERNFEDFRVIEIDPESVEYLKANLPGLNRIIMGDFLALDLNREFSGPFAIIGNFPYNISTQILFKVLNSRHKAVEVCGMFQKEVADRICSPPGSRTYGILSVLLQAYYNVEYLFNVPNTVFYPPPRVESAVVRLRRNNTKNLGCDEVLFFRTVRSCFNQRRKTLRNSVRSAFRLNNYDYHELIHRPEELSVERFVSLTNWIAENLTDSE